MVSALQLQADGRTRCRHEADTLATLRPDANELRIVVLGLRSYFCTTAAAAADDDDDEDDDDDDDDDVCTCCLYV